jgi:hypothetical protein
MFNQTETEAEIKLIHDAILDQYSNWKLEDSEQYQLIEQKEKNHAINVWCFALEKSKALNKWRR